jgi:ActR/RegA family two-component response regulator
MTLKTDSPWRRMGRDGWAGRDGPAGGDAAEPPAAAALASLQILIVEDDALAAAAFAAALRDRGHRVIGIADSAREAILRAAAQPPDLALVDITLADGRSGLVAAKALNDNFVVPTVLISGDANLGDAASAVRALDYIAKPADAEHVARTVHVLLQRRAITPRRRSP